MTSKHDANARGKAVALDLYRAEPSSRAWELVLEDAGDEWARASMVIREDMLNGHGTAHGGMVFALADTAFAWACNSRNARAVAQQASISFLSPARCGERVIAEARKEAGQGRAGVFTVRVFSEDGRDIAIFTGLSRIVGGAIIEQGDA